MGDMWVSPVPIIEINPTELINWVIAAWCIDDKLFSFFHILLFRKSTEQIVKVNRDHRSLQKFEMCGLFPLPEKQNSTLKFPTDMSFSLAMQEVWTLCRILKRVPSHKKYVPAAAAKQHPIIDSNSKTCSFESEISAEQNVSFGDSFAQRNERKPVIIDNQVNHERNHFFTGGQYDSITEAPFTAAFQNFWNPDVGDDFFDNGNWDELRTVVELGAIDPAQAYDYCR